jgi:cation diffusion facilitator family transporter
VPDVCLKLPKERPVVAKRRFDTLSSRQVIFAGIAGNLLTAALKFSAATWTGSSAMLSEAVHSLVDTGNSVLLLYGMHRAKQLPDQTHPLGYSREIYFWSFVVALLVFALGAGISLYEGIQHILNPEPIESAFVNYTVLSFSALFDGTTWWLALRNFEGRKRLSEIPRAIIESKDPPRFIALFEDSAALLGLVIAFAGTYLSVALELPEIDGIASILIAVVLAATAGLLARETKGLLIGETADQAVIGSILNIAGKSAGVSHANGAITVQIGPRQIVVALSLKFLDGLKTPEIEAKVVELEHRLRQQHPEVTALFIKPQNAEGFREARLRRFTR